MISAWTKILLFHHGICRVSTLLSFSLYDNNDACCQSNDDFFKCLKNFPVCLEVVNFTPSPPNEGRRSLNAINVLI